MCGGRGGRSVAAMTYTTPIRSLAGAVIAVLLCALAVAAPPADAAGKTETLKVFSKQLSFTFTKADGTVVAGPAAGPGRARRLVRDRLARLPRHPQEALEEADRRRLPAAARSASGPEPDCHGYTALGDSLLRFHGVRPDRRDRQFKDAKVLSNKEVPGGSDFVIRLTRR